MGSCGWETIVACFEPIQIRGLSCYKSIHIFNTSPSTEIPTWVFEADTQGIQSYTLYHTIDYIFTPSLLEMKLTTLIILLVVAVTGVSLASPYPRLYHPRYMTEHMESVPFAWYQQIDQALINHLKRVAVFCSMAKGSSDTQMIGGMLNQLCSSSPPTEDIMALLPNFWQQVEQTANFCNLYPVTDPGKFLSAVFSKCNTWSGLLNTICSSRRELCFAIFGAAAVPWLLWSLDSVWAELF